MEFPKVYVYKNPKIKFTGGKKEFVKVLQNSLISYNKEIEEFGKDFSNPQVYWYSKKYIVLYDAFPKSKIHLLILSRDPKVECFDDLTEKVVGDMDQIRKKLEKHLRSGLDKKFDIFHGFHSLPSLKCVHMHVFSNDFQGKNMKRGRHWNTFTQKEYFLSPSFVISELKKNGKVKIDKGKSEKIKHMLPECPICKKFQTKNIKSIRSHYLACKFGEKQM